MKNADRLRSIVSILFGCTAMIALPILGEGCYVSEQVVQLNNMQVDGQIHQVPIRVNDGDASGHLTITPCVEFMPSKRIEGSLQVPTDGEISSLPQYDTTMNLQWNLPSLVAGVGMDYGLTKVVSLSADGNYSQINGKHSFEWDLGLGLCFEGENSGGRLEGGVQWENMSYHAVFDKYEVDHYIFGGGDSIKYLNSFEVNGDRSDWNLYVNLTLNTRFANSPVNGFVRIGYSNTSLIDNDMFSSEDEVDYSKSVGFISLTPGLYYDMGKWNRIVVGCQFMSSSSLNTSTPGWLVSPVVQFDFTF